MTEENIDRLIAKALEEDLQLPKGLSERLERKIDRFKDEEQSFQKKRQQGWRMYGSIAASVALVIWILGSSLQPSQTEDYLADTFESPEEAAVYVAQTLQVISKSINKGVDPTVSKLNKTKKIDQTLHNLLK